jgi:hypothetical protein
MAFDYLAMYQEAKAELERLQIFKANHETKLVEVEHEIEAATRIANAAAAIIGADPVASLDSAWVVNADAATLRAAGISVASKAMIDSDPDSDFTAKLVKEALEKRGWDWKNYANPLSTLHTVLKRLGDSGAIKSDGDGKYYSTRRRERHGLLKPLPKPSESVRVK